MIFSKNIVNDGLMSGVIASEAALLAVGSGLDR
jgi:hypothetical protein